jgi:hypothetical protein
MEASQDQVWSSTRTSESLPSPATTAAIDPYFAELANLPESAWMQEPASFDWRIGLAVAGGALAALCPKCGGRRSGRKDEARPGLQFGMIG